MMHAPTSTSSGDTNDEAIPFDMLSTVDDSTFRRIDQVHMKKLFETFEKDPETPVKIVSGVTKKNMEVAMNLIEEQHLESVQSGKTETRYDSERECYDIFLVDLHEFIRQSMKGDALYFIEEYLWNEGWRSNDESFIGIMAITQEDGNVPDKALYLMGKEWLELLYVEVAWAQSLEGVCAKARRVLQDNCENRPHAVLVLKLYYYSEEEKPRLPPGLLLLWLSSPHHFSRPPGQYWKENEVDFFNVLDVERQASGGREKL